MKSLLSSFVFFCGLIIFFSCESPVQKEAPPPSAKVSTPADKEQAIVWADSAITLLYNRQFQWAASEAAFQKALELDPDLAKAHMQYGWLKSILGDQDEAIKKMEKAVALQPNNAVWRTWLAWMLWWNNEDDRALNLVDQALEMNAELPGAQFVKGSLLAEKGNGEEAMTYLNQVAAVRPPLAYSVGVAQAKLGDGTAARTTAAELADDPQKGNPFGIAEIYAVLGETDLALDWLEKAHEKRIEYLPWTPQIENFKPLADHPRFKAIMQDMGIPGF